DDLARAARAGSDEAALQLELVPARARAPRDAPARAGAARAGANLAGDDPLGPRLQDEVERRLGRAPHAREATLFEHLCEARLAGLGAEREADLLRERGGRADHGRGAVED